MNTMQDSNFSNGYTQDKDALRTYNQQLWKERIYRFFYAIWPSVNRTLSFFFYHLLRIIKGGVKIALEQFHQ